MIFDLHVHTSISPCSRLLVEDILTHAQKKGLDGVCITDHQTMDIRHTGIREGIQENGLLVIFGMEYETPDGDFLIFGPFEEIQTDFSARKLLNYVKEHDGVAIAAHPFRPGRSVKEYVIRQNLCRIIESVNGRNSDRDNSRVKKWTSEFDLVQTGGSDAHTLEELGKIKTKVWGKIECRNSFVRALKEGNVKIIGL